MGTASMVWARNAVLASVVIWGIAPIGVAYAGDITGSLELPDTIVYEDPVTGCANRQCFWNERNGIIPVTRLRRSLEHELTVVVLGRANEKTPKDFKINLNGGGMEPSTLVVGTGSSIEIINKDPYVRTLHAQNTKDLQGHSLASGKSITIKLQETGMTPVRDTNLTHAMAYIHTVERLAAVASVNSNGTFRFSSLEPGSYTLKVFYRSASIAEQTITVAQTGVTKLEPITVSDSTTK